MLWNKLEFGSSKTYDRHFHSLSYDFTRDDIFDFKKDVFKCNKLWQVLPEKMNLTSMNDMLNKWNVCKLKIW